MWILIVLMAGIGSGNGTGAGVAVQSINFASPQACEAARSALPKEMKTHAGEFPVTVQAICVPKG